MEASKFEELLERASNGALLPKYLGDDPLTFQQTMELLETQNRHIYTQKEFEDMFTAKWTNICSVCGFDWSGTVGYVCPAMNCPVQPKIT